MFLLETNASNATKFKFAFNFDQYVQLITIDWTDQTDTMAQQNVAFKLKITKY